MRKIGIQKFLIPGYDFLGVKVDELVKSQDLDDFEKSSRSRRANLEE